ncbi:MAG: DUF2721 domain-containing protein [Vampirovibrionales bacterium]|nr:DUF2721 domain-containing protein [Vampirovibrionales bacterium]
MSHSLPLTLDLTTPAVLLSAVSLLFLAYTNRFLAATSRTRQLYSDYMASPHPKLHQQIEHQRHRLTLIRDMQTLGAACLFTVVLSMLFIYNGWQAAAHWGFGIAMFLMLVSLVVSTIEIYQSTRALDIHLSDLPSPHNHPDEEED